MKKVIGFVFLVLFTCNSMIYADISPTERAALIALYNSTDGANWTNNTNWLGPVGTENTWHGVYCDGGNTKVISLSLFSNKLTGNIPAELGNLTNLGGLNLSYNQLTGNIPAELGNLTNLQALNLSGNQLTGSIPAELGNLTNLGSIHLEYNQLSGSIPAELGNLTNLSQLYLNINQLSGTIPVELGNLTNLSVLSLHSSQLTGTIPVELGNLTNLQHLQLNDNLLTGSIPVELGNIVNLLELHLHNNQLTGAIPAELANLINLERLYLYNNQLTGNIPVELGNFTNLKYLYLHTNQLSGSIPVELANLTTLTHLQLNTNQLTGAIPAELANLTNLYSLQLNTNQLSGSIPPELGNLTSLTYLHLHTNQLSGSIPAELGNLTNLGSLYLNKNKLTGNIPSVVGNLNPWALDIGYNALHTEDPVLITYLNGKDPDWADTQTIAPGNLSIGNQSATTVDISWSPIVYVGETGGYQIFSSTTPGGPYTAIGNLTANKTVNTKTVTGLNYGTTYYFVIRTQTDPHVGNSNTVYSEYSTEISATTTEIELLYFRTRQENSHAIIEWKTASEIDNAGFHIWRSEDIKGKYSRITGSIIPSNGGASWGARYSHDDFQVISGRTYYYKLQEIDNNGRSIFHGPVSINFDKK